IAGQSDEHVPIHDVPNEVFRRGVLGTVGMFLYRGATPQGAHAAMTEPQREMPCVPHDTLPPVVILDELAALAGIREDGSFAWLERGTDLAGELGRVPGVVRALDRDAP